MTRRPRERDDASTMFSTSPLRMVTENSVPAPTSTSASSAPLALAARQTSSATFRSSGSTTAAPELVAGIGASDGDARDQHRGHAHADGDALAVLAAGPAAVAELEV